MYLAAALRLNRSVVVDLICAAIVAAVRRLKGRPTEVSAGDSQRPKERLSRAHDHVVACDLNMTRMMPIWRHQPRKEAVQCPAAQNGGAESGETVAGLAAGLGRAALSPDQLSSQSVCATAPRESEVVGSKDRSTAAVQAGSCAQRETARARGP